MFANSIHPSTVSIFSASGSSPLQLFSSSVDKDLPADSFIHLLHDSASSPMPPERSIMIRPLRLSQQEATLPECGHELDQTALHIQSPDIRKTFICCPPESSEGIELGLKHPWVHIQVRNLGREWSFEVGLIDRASKMLRVRCSTFQRQPKIIQTQTTPLIHLPLSFPSITDHTLTTWSTISLHLASLLSKATTLAAATYVTADNDAEDGGHEQLGAAYDLPSSGYSHIAYIKIYATCRLRRIWFSEAALGQRIPWEFELYSATSNL
ncbi:Cilia- and flagella-associated protein 20/CFAP20DC [Pleurotus pulmonarius]